MLDLVGEPFAGASLVGRDPELAAVLESWGVDESPVSVHYVIGGDAGMGKTRFTSVLVDEVSSRGWRTVVGHCVDFESSVPYLPFSEALGRLAAVDPAGFESVVERTPAIVGLLPGRRILGGAGGGGEEPMERGELFDGMHAAFELMAAQEPLLLVVEDVHWADQSTRELLSVLFARPFLNPFAIVVTSRSDDLHRRHPLRRTLVEWVRLPAVQRIELGPLDRESMSSLVRRVEPSTVDGRVAEIVERAGGNPFFAEELAFADDAGGLPGDLSDALLVRLDHLSADEAQVVRAAA